MFHLETEVGHIKVNIGDHCSSHVVQYYELLFLPFLLYPLRLSQTPGMVKHSFSFCTQLKVLLYVKPESSSQLPLSGLVFCQSTWRVVIFLLSMINLLALRISQSLRGKEPYKLIQSNAPTAPGETEAQSR